MKRKLLSIVSLILVGCMLLGGLNVMATQENVGKVSIENVSGEAGETIEVPVKLEANPGIVSLYLSIGYDASVLRLNSIENMELIPDYMAGALSENPFVVSWEYAAATENIESTGTLVVLKFTILDGATPGDYEITVGQYESNTPYDIDLNDVEFTYQSGTVTVEIPAHDHIWSDWTETKAATCTEDGSKEHQCTVNGCTEKEIQAIPMTGHAYDGKQEELTKADCTNDGSIRVYCSNQDCTAYTDTVVNKLGHVESEWKEIKAAICTETGLKEKNCTVCKVTMETEIVDALGHSFGEWTIEKEAGCTEEGTLRKYCSFEGCNAYSDTTIPATGHTEGEWCEIKSATCTETGFKEKNCTACEEKITEEVIEALGHSYDEEIVVTGATCTEEGILHKYCSFAECNEYIEETIPFTNHVFGEWIVIKEAEVGKTGLKERICSTCEVKEQKEIEALNESDENTDTESKEENSPQTGDTMQMMRYLVVLMGAFAVYSSIMIYKKNSSKF